MCGSTESENDRSSMSNKRWVICFTNTIKEELESGVTFAEVIDIFVNYKINIVLVCYDLPQEDLKLGEHFVNMMREPNDDGIPQCDAHMLLDPEPAEVEKLFEMRLANYKIQRNSPLIIETFT